MLMSAVSPATIAGVDQHRVQVNGTELHYVSAGAEGSRVLLVHGFPESWWTFHKLIPLLSERHRVVAVDLRGFGDSAPAEDDHDSVTAARDLAELITHLGLGPVHVVGQDISGPTTFRLAATHPELVVSYTVIESGLPGFGLELLADVTHGGAWHIGVLAAPGVPEMLLAGRERPLLADYAFPSLTATPDAITPADVDEFVRAYARPGGFNGAAGLYRSMLGEAEEIRALADPKLGTPVLAVGGGSGDFTASAFRQAASDVTAATIDGIGHYVAMEAPDRLASTLVSFYRDVDGGR
jgi:pimeloyl-ACP methyl ester carboxylesterase